MNTLHENCKRIAALGSKVKTPKKAEAARQNARKPRPNARRDNKLKRTKFETKQRMKLISGHEMMGPALNALFLNHHNYGIRLPWWPSGVVLRARLSMTPIKSFALFWEQDNEDSEQNADLSLKELASGEWQVHHMSRSLLTRRTL